MKLLIFAHRFEVGGSQVNTIDLAKTLRDLHGYEVVLFASPGPMVEVARQQGLRFLPAPVVETHPTLAMMRALRAVVKRERPDLMQVWDCWQCLDAYYGEHLLHRTPMVVSDSMSDYVRRYLPKRLPMTFGTPEFVDKARAAGRRPVELLVPPVDAQLNKPGSVDPSGFRERYGLKAGELTLVTVSRLVQCLKSESLRRSIDAVRLLGRELPLRFLIVGDGNARAELDRLADQANTELGRPAIVLTGEMLDPRPAYAAADIVIGMGGSALRGMAFAKPVIIVGERGFSAPLTPETGDMFYYKGIYGTGDGDPGNAHLRAVIRDLAEDPEQLPALGTFSREFVLRHFALEEVTARLAAFFRTTVARRPQVHVAALDGLRMALMYRYKGPVPNVVRRLVKKHEKERLKQLLQAERSFPADEPAPRLSPPKDGSPTRKRGGAPHPAASKPI